MVSFALVYLLEVMNCDSSLTHRSHKCIFAGFAIRLALSVSLHRALAEREWIVFVIERHFERRLSRGFGRQLSNTLVQGLSCGSSLMRVYQVFLVT